MKLKKYIKNKLKKPIKKILNQIDQLLILKYNAEKRTILKVKLRGGLCNKLLYLFAACEIAHKNNFQLLEPEFGWHKKILFSDIYDIDYFNWRMSAYFGGKNILVAMDTVKDKKLRRRIRYDNIDLWQLSETNLAYLRTNKVIYSNSMMVNVLKSLKLNRKFDEIIDRNLNHALSVQFRIESDWVDYAKWQTAGSNETLLIDPNQLIRMLKDFKAGEVFFTTGENQAFVQSLLHANNIKSSYFYDNNLEYEINAAINFEILARSQKFIGLSRSSFSLLITLKRHLILNNPENYIYNYGNEITQRFDYGLYDTACDSVSITPKII
jgi:hypothetical protein